MRTVCLPVTMMRENTYFYYDENTKEGVILDPGGEVKKLIAFIEENGLKISGILLTHGHFDHMQAVSKIKEATSARVFAHKDEAPILKNPDLNMSLSMLGRKIEIEPDVVLEDGESVEFGENNKHCLRVLHTPGHTAGGVSYYAEECGAVFAGDTLFYESVGRTDFEGGDAERLLSSIREKLFTLPDNTIVHSGHGQSTSIAHEKRFNPFVKAD